MIRGLEKVSEILAKELTSLGFRWENRKIISKEKAALVVVTVFKAVIEEIRRNNRFHIANLVSIKTVKKGILDYLELRVKKKGDA